MAKGPNTKQKILKTSAKLFSESGYTTTSMSQIAQQVGITKPALYYHFKNKSEIVKELFENCYLLIEGEIKKICSGRASDIQKLEKIIKILVGLKTSHPFFNLLAQVGHSPKDRRTIAIYVRSYKKNFFEFLQKAVGELDFFSGKKEYSALVGTMIVGIVFSAFLASEKQALKVTEAFINHLKEGHEKN
jgi:AcrR family transcriptional regulator